MEATVRTNSLPTIPEGIVDRPYMGRFGQLYTQDWKQALIVSGKAFYAKVGAFSTPVVGGGAGTVIDLDQPEFGISIPSGKVLIPLLVQVQAQVPLLATDADESEILLAADIATAAKLDGTWTNTITPINLKTNSAEVSACTVKSVCTADTTDPVLDLELARAVITGDVQDTPANSIWTRLELNHDPRLPVFLVGPASLFLYWGGTVATSAFAQIMWAEINTTDL